MHSEVMHFLRYSAVTDVGRQRSNNEDCYLCSPALGLWLVADGMGGHAAGEVASAITRDTIYQGVKDGLPLKQAVQKAHKAIIQAVANGVGSKGMGSTVVAVTSRAQQYNIAWVGDSRAYLWSPHSQTLQQLTHDHSYVQMLVDTGAIEQEEMAHHPERNIITQCLGSQDLDTVKVDSLSGTWQKDEVLILCSDGLTDTVSDEQIRDLVSMAESTQACTRALVAAALQSGGRDNITVLSLAAPNQTQQWISAAGAKIVNAFNQFK